MKLVLDPQPGRRPCALCHAFTLVELLVVVAIIGLLAAILLPALQRARDNAYRVICLSNQRSQGQAMYLYSGDANAYFVPPYLRQPAPRDFYVLPGYAPEPTFDPAGADLGAYYSWLLMRGGLMVGQTKVFQCPNSDAKTVAGRGEYIYPLSWYYRKDPPNECYSLNPHFARSGVTAGSIYRPTYPHPNYLESLAAPSELPMILESRNWMMTFLVGYDHTWTEAHPMRKVTSAEFYPNGGYYGGAYIGWYWGDYTDYPGAGMNIVFLDGHGQYVEKTQQLVDTPHRRAAEETNPRARGLLSTVLSW